jgi:hypothetical protein
MSQVRSAASGAEVEIGRTGGGVPWTGYWYLLAAVIAALVVVGPPEWELAARTLLKHLALVVALPAVALTVMGSKFNSPLVRTGHSARLVRVLWPLLALALLVLAGSLHARFSQDIQNTFLNVGLYMLMTFCAAAMVMYSEDPEALVRGYFRVLLAAAAVMSVQLIANFGVRQVYHEQIFLVIPLAVLFFARVNEGVARWAGCAFFLAMSMMSQKWTSYLIGALTVTYLAVVVVFPRLSPHSRLQRVMVIYWSCLVGVACAAVMGYLAMRGAIDVPSGNVDYRMHTYLSGWNRFTESPWWGTLFAVEAVEKFTPFTIGIARNMLPTHSDVIDLLANGGVLAIALWLYALVRIARIAHANLLRPQLLGHPWAPYAHALAVMSLAGVVTYAFNPILLQPSMAYLLWTNLGMLAGLALRAAAADPRTRAGPDERPEAGPHRAAPAGMPYR